MAAARTRGGHAARGGNGQRSPRREPGPPDARCEIRHPNFCRGGILASGVGHAESHISCLKRLHETDILTADLSPGRTRRPTADPESDKLRFHPPTAPAPFRPVLASTRPSASAKRSDERRVHLDWQLVVDATANSRRCGRPPAGRWGHAGGGTPVATWTSVSKGAGSICPRATPGDESPRHGRRPARPGWPPAALSGPGIRPPPSPLGRPWEK
jgi:hypothetical protein